MADEETQEEQEQEIPDGLYSIRLHAAPRMCVDVAGAKDRQFTNIDVWEYYGGAGQLAYVSKKEKGYVIGFPLTGCVIHVRNGRARPGTNVFQYPYNNEDSQYWNFVDSGQINVVNGVTLKAYFVNTILTEEDPYEGQEGDHPQFEPKQLGLHAEGTTDGSNINIDYTWQATDHKFMFLFSPMPTLMDGTYRITSYLSGDGCLGVSGNSIAKGAKCVLVAPVEDSNFQIFKVENFDSGYCCIRCIETGFVLDSYKSGTGTDPDNPTPVILYPWKASDNQLWTMRYKNTKKWNGIESPIFNIIMKHGTFHPAIDARGKNAVPTTRVFILPLSNSERSDEQSFWFTPADAYGKNLTVPTDIHGYAEGSYGNRIGIDVSNVGRQIIVNPAWKGDGEEWQIRYRWRSRNATDKWNSTRTSWGDWQAIDTGYKINNGWGYPGQGNATVTMGDGRYSASEGVAINMGLTGTSRDYAEVEFEIRQIMHEWGAYSVDAHSGSATGIVVVAAKADLTIDSVVIDHNGATVDYTSSFKRHQNKIKIWVDKMFEVSGSDLKNTGTLTTPTLKRLPTGSEDGTAELTVKWSITTCDGITNTGATIVDAAISFTDAPTFTPTEEYFVNSNHTLRIRCPQNVSYIRWWLFPDQEEDNVIEINSNTKLGYIPYPLTKAFKVLIVGISNGSMVKFENSYPNRNEITRLWNFDDSSGMNHDYCIGTWANDNPPEESVNTTASNEDRPTTSGNWNRVTIGSVRSQSRSITSVIIDELDASGRERVKRLSAARYAWYRNPEGEVVRVAIISVNETRKYWCDEFSVEMRRIDEPTK